MRTGDARVLLVLNTPYLALTHVEPSNNLSILGLGTETSNR